MITPHTSSNSTADVVICGAGIAGVASAYHLAVKRDITDVVLVDPRPPLSLTSDKSMECYRNWFPGPGEAMVQLMNRSIDIMESLSEESGHRFNMNRRGYLFATGDPAKIDSFIQTAEEKHRFGAGPIRLHTGKAGEPIYVPAPPEGFANQPTGGDVILDPALIQQHFPYLTKKTIALLHTRRCGCFSAQQFGQYLLEQALAHGVRLIEGKVEGVNIEGNRIVGVRVQGSDGTWTISTRNFVSATGPFHRQIGRMMDVDIPIFSELHLKVAIDDHYGVISRTAPLTIWLDPVRLSWSPEEREILAESDETKYLLTEMPAGVHMRPEGTGNSKVILMQWGLHLEPVEPVFPLPIEPEYAELVLRGLAVLIPGLATYFGRMPKPFVDGGYYVKTRENRPLIGPLPVDGAYIIGALSGYGLQASSGAGELLSFHVAGETLPSYGFPFLMERYEDQVYLKELEKYDAESGQI